MKDRLNKKIEDWENSLIDLGKRNRLINFKDGKLNNIKITSPSCDKLYEVISEKSLKFPFAAKVKIDEFGEESNSSIHYGDIETTKEFPDLKKALRYLRLNAKNFREEKGINILYLSLGLIKWAENDSPKDILSSPLLLLPVELTNTSSIRPYELSLRNDEILTNPSLTYKLEHDFNIKLPQFDSTSDEINAYFTKIESFVADKNWTLSREAHLTLLSFAKMSMYNDISKNIDKIKENPIVNNLVGISNTQDADALAKVYNHDEVSPKEVFQVLDADSSQQDAIVLAKQGHSFVLQGPPGTGKSQTIANIIAEKLAEGKTVLFVSEKLAALNVVYDKLAAVNLSPFCLTLHKNESKNSSKKEFLEKLYESINLSKTKTPDSAILDLENLERARDKLNSYDNALHTPVSALNSTIYDVNAQLAKLAKFKDISFDIDDIESSSKSQLEDRKYNLQILANAIAKQQESLGNNAWRNSVVEKTSHRLYHDIDSKFVLLFPSLEELNDVFSTYSEKFKLLLLPTLNNVNIMLEVLDLAIKSPIIPSEWILKYGTDKLLKEAILQSEKTQETFALESYISKLYKDSFRDIDAAGIKSGLINSTIKINSLIAFDNNNQLVEKLDETQKVVAEFSTAMSSVYDAAKALALDYDVPCNTLADILRLNKITKLFSQNNISLTRYFFDYIDEVKETLSNGKKEELELIGLEQEVLADFDKEIFDLDFYSILKEFRCDYGLLLKRVFSKKYWAYVRSVKACRKSKIKMDYEGVLALLNRFKIIAEKKAEIESKKELYISYFGDAYKGLGSKWENIELAVSVFEEFLDIFKYDKIPLSLRDKILSKNMIDENFLAFREISESTIETGLIADIEAFNISDISAEAQCLEAMEILQSLVSELDSLALSFKGVLEQRNAPASYDDIISELTKLEDIQAFYVELKEKDSYMQERYAQFYTGVNTNWKKAISALEYAKELKNSMLENNLSRKFVKEACENKESIEFFASTKQRLESISKDMSENLSWALSLFAESEGLRNCNLRDLIDRLSSCKERKDLLEEWIDYCRHRRNCEAQGLANYIEEIESNTISPEDIVPIYLKRFYNLWLDKNNSPVIESFRGDVQNKLIEEFKALDTKQFKTSQSRIYESIIDRMPDFDRVSSTKEEIGILKRELAKQRKIKPIRRLLREIPNLITTLRPCFMMSPLSVSVFLEAGDFKFDTVIFDEASQICTEDAIGAIMRAEQIIVVGDRQQLPPTSFFRNYSFDEDFDKEDEGENDDAGAYQSILDEAVFNMPELSLKWHYRSRNEELIALSNTKMYNNSLFTFPSPHTKVADSGMEFVYVEDGVYDRGGKRNNIIEARKVADLVFEHFAKYQDERSLGVVTFSASQMTAIENAILYKRQENPAFDAFFNEDKDSPFFVKNIENIQGDERDTIIMSVGYGKDINGKMYNNFGAVSVSGGERRLNVAITRAKHNVKLVSSILPSDIVVEKDTTKKGVEMLKMYLELAKNGIQSLENELSFKNRVDAEYPFEEAVCEFLEAKGYKLETQVGCAGYKIDMAIKDRDGNFILGIECDGATYHNSRTARERDRLRQSVLEDIGWTIYRIWSTDWVKHREAEEQSLIAAIEKAAKG